MELYLMQHGQALPADADPEKPLSREGIARIKATAGAMKRLGINLELIACSPRRRAHQSAALVAETINYPYSDIVETEKLKPTATTAEAIDFLRRQAKNRSVLLVGHLPLLPRLASHLLAGNEALELHFENGALCRIDSIDLAPGGAELIHFIPPLMLRQLSGTA